MYRQDQSELNDELVVTKRGNTGRDSVAALPEHQLGVLYATSLLT